MPGSPALARPPPEAGSEETHFSRKAAFPLLGTSRGILRCAQDDDSNGCQLADARSLTPALRLLAADQHHVGICVASNQGELSSIGRPVIVPDMLRFK